MISKSFLYFLYWERLGFKHPNLRTNMTGTPLNFDEIETVKILRANGLTFHAISLKIQRDPKTIKKACLDPVIASEIIEIQEVLADQYESLSRRMIDSITDEDIEKLNAYQRTIASGICTDKMRLLRNESTSKINIDTINENIDATDEKIIKLEIEKAELTGESIEDIEAERKKLRNKVLKRLGKPLLRDEVQTPKQKNEN